MGLELWCSKANQSFYIIFCWIYDPASEINYRNCTALIPLIYFFIYDNVRVSEHFILSWVTLYNNNKIDNKNNNIDRPIYNMIYYINRPNSIISMLKIVLLIRCFTNVIPMNQDDTEKNKDVITITKARNEVGKESR